MAILVHVVPHKSTYARILLSSEGSGGDETMVGFRWLFHLRAHAHGATEWK